MRYLATHLALRAVLARLHLATECLLREAIDDGLGLPEVELAGVTQPEVHILLCELAASDVAHVLVTAIPNVHPGLEAIEAMTWAILLEWDVFAIVELEAAVLAAKVKPILIEETS